MNKTQPAKARRDLPEDYSRSWHFDIQQKREAIILSIWGVVLFLAAWIIFLPVAQAFQPEAFPAGTFSFSLTIGQSLIFLGELLLVTVIMLVLHEGLHGLFFWYFTRERPKFDFKIYYASAAAPEWYIPRRQYFFIALAPLVGITLLCLAVLAWLPKAFALPAFLMLIFNTSGAVGDLWVTLRLAFSLKGTYVQDHGDCIEFFKQN